MEDSDMRRLEEKMKLANLQIDKRLATMEKTTEELQKNLRNVTEEIVELQNEQGQVLTQATRAENTVNEIVDIADQFKNLRKAFVEMSSKFRNMPTDDVRQMVESLSERVSEMEINVTTKGPEDFSQKMSEINVRFDVINKRLVEIVSKIETLERQIAISSPIILD